MNAIFPTCPDELNTEWLSSALGRTVENFETHPIGGGKGNLGDLVLVALENGEQVVLEEGYLPEALGASAALPSLFSPVLLDDKVLIDGGVVNNYPVKELRDKGMEIIIGVDVQDTLRGRDRLKSATEVLLQINNYRTAKAMETKKKDIKKVWSFMQKLQFLQKDAEVIWENS